MRKLLFILLFLWSVLTSFGQYGKGIDVLEYTQYTVDYTINSELVKVPIKVDTPARADF